MGKRERVFHGTRFDVDTVQLPERSGATVQREVVVHPGAVTILPLLDDGRIVMIHNERFAVGETLWELPAGTLERGESPDVTAAREIREETGYRAGRIEHLLDFYTTPGFCNEKMYAYVARDLKQVGQELDDSEQITVEVVTEADLRAMMHDNIIRDGKTLTVLLYYLLVEKEKCNGC